MSKYVPLHPRKQQVPIPAPAKSAPGLTYSKHAALRMQQRGIKSDDVEVLVSTGHTDANEASTVYRTAAHMGVVGSGAKVVTAMPNHRNTRFDPLTQTREQEAELRAKVARNNDVAMCELAELYLSGSLGEPDVAKAHVLLLRAAERHHNSHAICKLSELHSSGKLGTNKWMMMAANHGNKFATAVVGQDFMKQYQSAGSDVSPDEKLQLVQNALFYLEQSAAKGSTRAKWSIAYIHEMGWLGVPDLPKAIGIYMEAAKKGSPASLESLNKLVKTGQFSASELERILDEMSPIVAETSSQMALQLGLEQIDGVLGSNPKRGLKMLEGAANNKNEDATRTLVKIHKDGRGKIKANPELSIFWAEKLKALYEVAALEGNIDAMWELGELLLSGDLGTKDMAAAEMWFLRAANSGSSDYLYSIGIHYMEGTLGDKARDRTKGQDFIKRAIKIWSVQALNGDREAAIRLAEVYHNGDLGEQDLREAIRWFTVAADLGDLEAAHQLITITLGMKEYGAAYKDLAKATSYIEQIVSTKPTTTEEVELIGKTLGLLIHLRTRENIEHGLPWFTKLALNGQTMDDLLRLEHGGYSLLQKKAIWHMAQIHVSGVLGATNYPEASKYLVVLSHTGHRQALTQLVQMHQKGYLHDDTAATEWTEKFRKQMEAREVKDIDAAEAMLLGILCKQGEFTPKDLEKGTKYLCIAFCAASFRAEAAAAEQELQSILTCRDWTCEEIDQIMTGIHSLVPTDHVTNTGDFFKVLSRVLGDVYNADIIIERDIQEAMSWYKTSAKLGNSKAMCSLGKIYLQDITTSFDNLTRAIEWFSLAVKQNQNPDAMRHLSEISARADLDTALKEKIEALLAQYRADDDTPAAEVVDSSTMSHNHTSTEQSPYSAEAALLGDSTLGC
jgi:TPR repeat protein